MLGLVPVEWYYDKLVKRFIRCKSAQYKVNRQRYGPRQQVAMLGP